MHQSVRKFIEDCITQFGIAGKTLEVGSLDVCGNVRDLFSDYTGIDFRPGKNVDQVMNGADLKFPDDTFDVVLYVETMEHDLTFWETIKEMRRVLKPGGFLLITTRSINFIYHPHPADYYRFTPDYFKQLPFEKLKLEEDPQASGVFFLGKK